jgi:PBP1b-binding outer membrane lipoprotein LpoB
MKKLLLVLSIVFFLLSCDDAGMENQDNSQETSQVELKEPKNLLPT